MPSIQRGFSAVGFTAPAHLADASGMPSPQPQCLSASHRQLGELGRPPTRSTSPPGHAVVNMPGGNAGLPAAESELTAIEKRLAVAATILANAITGVCNSGFANKLPSAVLQAGVGSMAGEFSGELAGAAGNLIGYPFGAFAHQHVEAATVSARLALASPTKVDGQPDTPSCWAGVDYEPRHPFEGRDLWIENFSLGVSATVGAVKGMVKAVLPSMHPAAGAMVNLALDFCFSILSQLVTQIWRIVKNPEGHSMVYKKVEVPNCPAESNPTLLCDRETANRVWSSVRSSLWAMGCDLAKALLLREAVDGAEKKKNVVGLGLLNAVKDGTTQYAYNQGRRTEAGAKPGDEPRSMSIPRSDQDGASALNSELRHRRPSSINLALTAASGDAGTQTSLEKHHAGTQTEPRSRSREATPPGTYRTVITWL